MTVELRSIGLGERHRNGERELIRLEEAADAFPGIGAIA
jgi:hypothetical protein